MKPFVLTTCVWGDLHIDAMMASMVPTLLAPGNLPELARLFDVNYRISTTHRDAARLRKHPLIVAIQGHVKVEFVVATDEEAPGHIHHVNWYHQAIAEARSKGALVAFLPPDVTWSGVTLGNMGRHMANGRAGTAMPYVRVISESILPTVTALRQSPLGAIDISGRELMRLAIEHMHPLSAVASDTSRHGRPSLEMLWHVPGEGLLLRNMVRELFSFDPSRLDITHLWYAGRGAEPEDIHIVTDSDEMLMLSFAPLMKDIALFLQGRPIVGEDTARQSLHPLNDTPLNPHFAEQNIRLHYAEITPERWIAVEALADAEFGQSIVARELMQVRVALKEFGGCSMAIALLSSAVLERLLAEQWPVRRPSTIVIPEDSSFDSSLPWHLLDESASGDLQRWIFDRISPGPYDPASGLAARRTISGIQLGSAEIKGHLDVAGHSVVVTAAPMASVPAG